MLTCGVLEPFPSRHGGRAGRGPWRHKGTAEVAPSMPPSHAPATPQHPEDPLVTNTWPSPSVSSWSSGLSLSLLIPTACDSSPWSRLALDVVALRNSFHVEGERWLRQGRLAPHCRLHLLGAGRPPRISGTHPPANPDPAVQQGTCARPGP